MKKTEQAAKRKVRWNSLPCPGCGTKNALMKIIYGMPTPDFDYSKNISGGCCLDFNSPDFACKSCNWQGRKEDLPNYVPVLRVSKKITPTAVKLEKTAVKLRKKVAVPRRRIIRKPRVGK